MIREQSPNPAIKYKGFVRVLVLCVNIMTEKKINMSKEKSCSITAEQTNAVIKSEGDSLSRAYKHDSPPAGYRLMFFSFGSSAPSFWNGTAFFHCCHEKMPYRNIVGSMRYFPCALSRKHNEPMRRKNNEIMKLIINQSFESV